MAPLDSFFRPRAVAVIGASRDPKSVGRRVFDALRTAGFAGPVYPVNPHATDLDGQHCYATARDLPAGVDLGVIAVPTDSVLAAVEDCAAARVNALVILTAGFAECDASGRARQQQLVEKVRGNGMRMVGPNCMGLLNTDPLVRLNASFSPVFPPAGHVGLLSQSGALGIAILELAVERRLGLSTFISVGNKADVSGNDLLEYWEGDAATRVILLYLESFGNPRRFAQLARRVSRVKPIVALKSGRTRAGVRAAASHTAALAASDVASNALFHQTGVIRADTIDEMFDLAAALDAQPLPSGRRVLIVTNAGGPAILAVDACEAAGLLVPELSADTRTRFAAFLPATANIANPVDMIASAGPDEFRRAMDIAMTAGDADTVLVIYTPIDRSRSDEILAAIREGIAAGRRSGTAGRPILACVMAKPGRPEPLELDGEVVPAYAFPENAVRALGKICRYAEWRAQPPGRFSTFEDQRIEDIRGVCAHAVTSRGDTWLTEEEIRQVLGAAGLPVVPSPLARTPDEAAALAEVVGFPVAIKLASRQILHKSDIGGVQLGLSTADAVRKAFDGMMAAAKRLVPDSPIEGVVVQPMISGGIETIIGVSEDPLFGPLIGFGLGGIHVELMGDVRFRVAPLTDRDAEELIREIRGFPLLQGYRGRAAADLDALRDILLRVSRLAQEVHEISEMDLNPVIALPPGHGCRIVDARIRVKGAAAERLRPPR